MQGHCQCGAISFTTPTEKPLAIFVCHCLECRHQSSSAFGISAIFPSFEMPMPFMGVYTRPTDSGSTLDCYFCKTCGCRVMHRSGGPNVTLVMSRVAEKEIHINLGSSIKGGCLDGFSKEMMQDAVHIWTKRAIVPIPKGRKSFPKEPDEETTCKGTL